MFELLVAYTCFQDLSNEAKIALQSNSSSSFNNNFNNSNFTGLTVIALVRVRGATDEFFS